MDQGALFAVDRQWWLGRSCPVCGGPLRVAGDLTYVVQRQGWVKIGMTSDLPTRLRTLSLPSWTLAQQAQRHPEGMDADEPLVLLLAVPQQLEHAWHVQWSRCHVVGEWFLPDAEMRAWLSATVVAG